MRKYLISLLTAAVLLPQSAPAIPLLPPPLVVSKVGLPNECAIIASEAVVRLQAAGAHAEMLQIVIVDTGSIDAPVTGHMLAVWQVVPDGVVFIYDDYYLRATLSTRLHKLDAATIARYLNDTSYFKDKHTLVLEGRFVK